VAAFAQNPTTADALFQVGYAVNLNQGESFIDIVNTGASGAPSQGPGGAAAGNICANLYTFSPTQQLISCCSCLVSPNAVINLGVNRDLIVNQNVPTITTSVTIKLVATLAGTGGTGTDCTGNAAFAGAPAFPLALAGLAAFGTTLHQQPAPGGEITYAAKEARFTPATLSNSELSSITNQCYFIQSNLGSSGICSFCSPGAR